MKLFGILLFIFILNSFVFGANPPVTNPINTKDSTVSALTEIVMNPPVVEKKNGWIFLTSLEFLLSMSVLVFGLIIISLEIYLIKINKIDPSSTIKFIIVTLIITETLFLITCGYSNNQIAPVVGLFGTVVGYLLGKSDNKTT